MGQKRNETDSERVQETVPAFYAGRSARTRRSQYLLAQRLIDSTSGDATSDAYASTDARLPKTGQILTVKNAKTGKILEQFEWNGSTFERKR